MGSKRNETLLEFGRRLEEAREENKLTLKELGDKVGLSESTMSRYERGLVDVKRPTVISLAEVLGVNPAWLSGFPGADKYLPELADPKIKQVPILGRIACGGPIVMHENIEGYENAPAGIDVDFCLLVKGDSMINARIFDGDVVCIKQQPTVENGEIAAVIINGEEVTLKRFYQIGENVILRSENPKYRDLIFGPKGMDDIKIIGKAIYLRTEVR